LNKRIQEEIEVMLLFQWALVVTALELFKGRRENTPTGAFIIENPFD
jgi:hypothetical protein